MKCAVLYLGVARLKSLGHFSLYIKPLKRSQIVQHHWLVFLVTSMESSSNDSVLVSTTDWRLLVAEPQTCRSAGEICLSSLRHKRTGVISLLSPQLAALLSFAPCDCVCVWLCSGTSVFLCVWKSEDEEGQTVWCACLFM